MATDFKSIPVIDVSPLLDKCDSFEGAKDVHLLDVVKKLDSACREAGFFYVKGHGIPDSFVNKVRAISRSFFDLPYEEKIKIKMTSETGFRGYQRIGENITEGIPDMHEAIDYCREITSGMYGDLGAVLVGSTPWPEYPVEFKSLMEEYVTLLTDLARKILRGIALALDGSVNTFEDQRAGDPFWLLRVIGYPGAIDLEKLKNGGEPGDIGCGAHTDYGLLTLVNQDDDVVALQVRNNSGEWIDAPPIPGTFICNIGDMLKIYCNGEYESTLHRVINNSPDYRVSVAFFYETNFDTLVEPLDFCKERTGGVPKFGKVVYGEHLVKKVLSNFVSY